ncbi:MAG: hypothetical protein ACD_69C00353G0004 [uncultured bacterium]|nr:MAG: hypothetical protein ACD_69C00353G0004 [uncultured bacterium]
MMKSFSKLYSDFWINYDNSEVVSLGIDAQLMALYLQGNSHHNMLGVYYLPLLYIASDLKLPVEQVSAALQMLCKINYCKYDDRTQHIWVCNMVFEQIGEDVGIKDNRIKALHAIWESLPSKLEFLEEIYHKYHIAIHLESRVFEKPSKTCEIRETKEIKETKNELAVTDVSLGINKNTNANANVDITGSINTDTATNSVVSTDIQSYIGSSPLSYPFEASSEYLEGLLEGADSYAVFENNSLVTPSESDPMFLEDFFAFSDSSDSPDTETSANTPIILQSALGGEVNERNERSGRSSVALTPSKPLMTPFEGASKPLASPFEGPSDPLRSNIEDRIEIIEVRSKKEEIEEELEKEKRRDIHNSNVLLPSTVAHEEARQRTVKKLPDKNFTSFEKLEETEKTPFAQCTSNFPIIQACSNLASKAELALVAKSTEPKSIDTKNNADASVAAVFEHWKNVMQHPKSNLDCKRKSLIRKALQLGYSVQQLCDAITGCSYTPHNTGQNKQGQRYDGLHIILKDADQIDRFIHNYHHPPEPFTEANQRLLANVNEASKWAEKKLSESADIFRRNNYV